MLHNWIKPAAPQKTSNTIWHANVKLSCKVHLLMKISKKLVFYLRYGADVKLYYFTVYQKPSFDQFYLIFFHQELIHVY